MQIKTKEEAQRLKENLIILKSTKWWHVLKEAIKEERKRLEEKILNDISADYNEWKYSMADLDKVRRQSLTNLLDYPDYLIEQMGLDADSNNQDDPYIT